MSGDEGGGKQTTEAGSPRPGRYFGCSIPITLGCAGLLLFLVIGGYVMLRRWQERDRHYSMNLQGRGEVGELYQQARGSAAFDPTHPRPLTQARLEDFWAVRTSCLPILKRHRAVFLWMTMRPGPRTGFGDRFDAVARWYELRLAYAHALVAARMSPEEYDRVAGLVSGALEAGGRPVPRFHTPIPSADPGERELLRGRIEESAEEVWLLFEELLRGTSLAQMQGLLPAGAGS